MSTKENILSYANLLAVLGILFGMFFIIFFYRPVTKNDLNGITNRYDPVFKNILLKDAYGLLADIRLSELPNHPDVLDRLDEVKLSLQLVGAFDNKNQGLLKIIELIEKMSNSNVNKLVVVDEFLRINLATQSSMALTPPESSYFLTFQGLCYLVKMREADNQQDYLIFLGKAKEKFATAKQTYSRISNLWNGMGVCLLEEAHSKGVLDLKLIESARNHFNMSFNLYRSPIGLATQINNYTYSNLVIAFYNTFNFVRNSEGGVNIKVKCDKKIVHENIELLRKSDEKFQAAQLYDPNSLAIILSRAEAKCMLALCEEALNCQKFDQIVFSNNNKNLADAMYLIRLAKEKGYNDWEYLYSRLWITNTLFRIEKYSKELSGYITY